MSNQEPVKNSTNQASTPPSQPAPLNPEKDQQQIYNDVIMTPFDDKEKDKASNISTNSHSSNSNFKILTKYKDIYVPRIYLMNYEDLTQPPFNNIKNTNYSQINNNQNAIYNKDYLNYGYNLEQWKIYATEIKNKFDELNELVKNGKIRLLEPENELEYLMNFPSDYGGLGRLYNDQNYENVKFYDPKDTTQNPMNKNFMSLIKFDEKDHQIWFNLEPNPSSLNNINNGNKINTNSVNSTFPIINKYFYPIFCRNPQNSQMPNVVNLSQIGTNNTLLGNNEIDSQKKSTGK